MVFVKIAKHDGVCQQLIQIVGAGDGHLKAKDQPP